MRDSADARPAGAAVAAYAWAGGEGGDGIGEAIQRRRSAPDGHAIEGVERRGVAAQIHGRQGFLWVEPVLPFGGDDRLALTLPKGVVGLADLRPLAAIRAGALYTLAHDAAFGDGHRDCALTADERHSAQEESENGE